MTKVTKDNLIPMPVSDSSDYLDAQPLKYEDDMSAEQAKELGPIFDAKRKQRERMHAKSRPSAA